MHIHLHDNMFLYYHFVILFQQFPANASKVLAHKLFICAAVQSCPPVCVWWVSAKWVYKSQWLGMIQHTFTCAEHYRAYNSNHSCKQLHGAGIDYIDYVPIYMIYGTGVCM